MVPTSKLHHVIEYVTRFARCETEQSSHPQYPAPMRCSAACRLNGLFAFLIVRFVGDLTCHGEALAANNAQCVNVFLMFDKRQDDLPNQEQLLSGAVNCQLLSSVRRCSASLWRTAAGASELVRPLLPARCQSGLPSSDHRSGARKQQNLVR